MQHTKKDRDGAGLAALEASYQRRHGRGARATRATGAAIAATGASRKRTPNTNASGGASHARSAANSHQLNAAYMDEFAKGYRALGGEMESYSAPRGGGAIKLPPSLKGSNPFRARPLGKISATFRKGPREAKGTLMDASDRNLVSMSIHAASNEVVVGCLDHASYCFDYTTGRRRRQLHTKRYGHHEWVTAVKHLPDGRILSAGMDSKLCLWPAKSGCRCVDLNGHFKSITDVLISEQGRHAASISYDQTVRFWDLTTKREVGCFEGHNAPLLTADWGYGYICSGDRNGDVKLWDLTTGTCVRDLCRAHRGHCTATRFLPSGLCGGGGCLFVTGGQDGFVNVWDVRNPKPIVQVGAHRDAARKASGAVSDIRFTNAAHHMSGLGGDVMLSSGADQTIAVMDPRASFVCRAKFTQHKDFIYSMEIAGTKCFSGAGNGVLFVHDLTNGKLLYGLGANKAAVRCIGVLPDQLLVAGDDGNILSFDYS